MDLQPHKSKDMYCYSIKRKRLVFEGCRLNNLVNQLIECNVFMKGAKSIRQNHHLDLRDFNRVGYVLVISVNYDKKDEIDF